MHHCIQGWSGIAHWGGLPFKRLIEIVKPRPEARVVAFYSFGEALYGGEWRLGAWRLHPLVLLFALSGTLMISKTLRIPKL